MSRQEDNERTTVLVIGGMHCAACVGRVENALRSVGGVETAGVNLLTRLATVRHAANIEPRTLADAVSAVGYQASLASPGAHAQREVSFGDTIDIIASRKSRFVAGAMATVLIVLVNRLWATEDAHKLFVLFMLATPVQITVGWEFYRGFFHALRRGKFTTDSLVVIGSSAAYFQGFMCFMGQVTIDLELAKNPQFHVAAMILTVMSLGKWLEARAQECTRQIWRDLIDIAPQEACVLRDGREQIIPAGVVAFGDIVVVRAHEKIPVDGEVVDGSSEVNEGLITGEGLPVPKVKGDRVIAASANGAGFLKIRALGVGYDTTIAQIAKMVATAQRKRKPSPQIADRIAAYVAPISVVAATCVFVTSYFGPLAAKGMVNNGILSAAFFSNDPWLAFLLKDVRMSAALGPAIAVLVIGCPCALGLAASTAVIVATGMGSRWGILIKGGDALESAARVTDVVFDKKRALTDGSYSVEDVIVAPGMNREDLMLTAYSIEACSQHALAKGIVKDARKNGLELRNVDDFEPLSGRGLRGTVGKKSYLLGSKALILEHGCQIGGEFERGIAAAEATGATLIFVAEESGALMGAFAMADSMKESAVPAIADLRTQGLHVHLLSGDTEAAALAVGRQSGLQDLDIHAQLKPEDKVDFTQQLKGKGRCVAVVGDGISDAAALAAADVGFALGAGTGIAIESGQIVLVSTDVRGVSRALRLSRAATRIIRWNMFWAFSINFLLVPFALLTDMNPAVWSVGAAALVTLNSMRLRFVRVDDVKRAQTPTPPVKPPAKASPILAGPK